MVDAEDTFTSMLTVQLRSLGLVVDVRRFDEPYAFDGHDLVVMGPGPGDPLRRRPPQDRPSAVGGAHVCWPSGARSSRCA